jgi:hypothetical protein
MKYTITHRRYPNIGWDYKAITIRYDDKNLTYYTLVNKGKKSEGLEVYQGYNYIVGDNGRSYSRRYTPLSKVPKKYEWLIPRLKKFHRKTKWSRAKYVNKN